MRSPIPALIPLLALGACAATGAGPHGATLASFDGLPLAYEAHGAGAPTLVFIHGWCGARALWNETMAALADERRVIALDLGGHGGSGRERASWTLEACARDVAALLAALELEDAILVGHSMGGPVALLAAALAPARVAGVIGVETLHQVDQPYERDFAAPLARSLERDFDGTVERYVRAALPLELDPKSASALVALARGTDRRAAVALLGDYAGLDVRAALRDCPVPVRCINSAHPVPTDVAAARRWSPGFEAVLLERTGHFPMVEAPALLASTLSELLADWPAAR